jgi:hypothetical protein
MLRFVCQSPNPGGGSVGDMCSDDSECAANLCLNGQCSKPCQRPIQCSQDGSYTCGMATVGGQDITACKPAPAKACTSDQDCAGAKKCVARQSGGNIEFVCASPNTGGGSVGDSCTDDSDCLRNLCVDGTCTDQCQADPDCSSASGYTCQTTQVDVGGGSMASASICVPPRRCSENDECKVGEVCYIDRSSSASEPGVCRQNNPGGGGLGSVCQKDGQCAANLCYAGRFRDICSVACKGPSDCTKPGYRCESTDIDDGSGGTRNVKICVPAPPSSCSKPADCPDSNETCAVVTNTAGTGLERVCIPDPGGLATGNACTKDTDCKSRVCLNGFCASPCTMDGQCANDQLCRSNMIDKSGQTGTFDVCETLPPEKCTQSGSCSDRTRVCSSLQTSGGRLEGYCRFPNSSATQTLGDSCSMNADCQSGLCLSQITSNAAFVDQCSAICRNNSQCGTGQICTSLPFSNTDAAACTKPCSTNNDCAGNNVCVTNENQLNSPYTLDTICMKRTSGNTFGQQCGSAGCQNGLCLNTYTFRRGSPNYKQCTPGQNQCASGWGCYRDAGAGNQYYCAEVDQQCTKLCSTDNQCGGGASGTLDNCGSVTITLSDGTQSSINACNTQ